MKAVRGIRKGAGVLGLLMVLSILFAFGPALASSGGGHGDGAGKGMDLLWRTMNFAVLVGALVFLLRKPVSQGLASRRQGIKDQFDDLEKQKQDAQRQLAEYKEKLTYLDKEIEKIMAEYIQEGETAKAKIIEEAKVAAEKLQEQAKKHIAREFLAAKQQLKAEMAEEAMAMAEALIKRHINDNDQERLIDEYLAKVVVAR